MAKLKAAVQSTGDKHYIAIHLESDVVQIPMSEDNPNQVKKAFNRLIEHARVADYAIELADVKDDLFSQVANEYIRQLNREIQEVRAEMKQFKLLRAAGR